ncbi:MmcB family DNA repair protein, partial [Rhizobium brockwellii]|uniref:MmcB family DNA repair protein n=1 Tax=Rhizobium brockwellii TaxID=3019932 RepID=UPI003F97C482
NTAWRRPRANPSRSTSRVPLEIFPEDCGLFLSDGYGAHMIREAPEHRMAPATRKSVTLNFSRAAGDLSRG